MLVFKGVFVDFVGEVMVGMRRDEDWCVLVMIGGVLMEFWVGFGY